jgi:class 3 adenylate cyclase
MQSREVLIATYWPEMDERLGRANLSTALSSLRNQLEPPGTPQGSVIRADRHSVGLNLDMVTTDVREFERLLDEAAAGSKWERAQSIEDALAIYGGPLLPGHYESWITPEQERLSGLFLDAVGELITLREGSGDLAGAVSIARRAVAVDPLREEGQEHLIRLLAASGKGGAALRQYKEFERLLEEELGDEPPASLRRLAHRIEKEMGSLGEVPAALPAPAPQAPRKARPSAAPSATVLPVSPNRSVTVNFLFTDIAESTRQWEKSGAEFSTALEMHHRLLRDIFVRYGGQEVSEAGDGFVVAFASAKDALLAAVDAQRALAQYAWPESIGALKVRMALHTGDVEFKDGEYHGLPLHRASRMLSAAHGGQILLSEATAGVVRRDLAEDFRLVDLGVYRLRDVPTAERLFQVEWPDMGSHDFGPLAAEAGHGAHLPQTFTRFFGREREIDELAERLRTPGTRLVTVTGTGGTGKTRLALEVAHRVEEHFQGAVWFAALADISDPALIPDTVLDSLGVSHTPQKEPLEQVVEHLGKQPSLLVLDNLEHLIDAGGAKVVQSLLQRVPTLTLLTTSRMVLGLGAEREYVLQPLPTPHGQNGGPETLSAYDSVALFIDRAQTAQSDFQINNTNAPAVAELVSRLEGIPLAIELAAARAQVLSPAQMLQQLSHRLDTLASRKRDVSERQRTLRGAIDWSYRLLSPQLQQFFTCLSVFRGAGQRKRRKPSVKTPWLWTTLPNFGKRRSSCRERMPERYGSLCWRPSESMEKSI